MMTDFPGAYSFNNRFDWSRPRVQVRAQDSTETWLDLSERLISFDVKLAGSYAADTWSVVFSNTDQYITDNIQYAKPLEISATFNQFDQEKLIQGRVEDPQPAYSKSSGATMTLSGKDWTAELQNVIALELYKTGSFTPATKPYIGEMVRDLITKYAPAIDASGVPDTSTQIDYKLFARMPVFDCIKFLADLIDYRFYVDTDKALIFEPIPTSTFVSDDFTGTGDPAGWTEQSGTWAIVSNAYKQTNNTGSFTSYRTTEDFEDLVIDTYITIDEGTRAGIVLKTDTATGNHYFVALDVAENLIKLYRVPAWTGAKTELMVGVPSTDLAHSTAYHIRIFCKTIGSGCIFYVYVTDMVNCALTWEDEAAYITTGKVGCRTEDAVASFDDFTAGNAYLVIEEGFNCTAISLKTQLSRQKNRVYVQGGYEKFPYQEVITPSGSTDQIPLTYLPSEVRVLVAGDSVPKKGGIYGIDDDDATVYFLVDYWGKILYRRGGNWDASETTIDYNRNTPLMAMDEDTSTYSGNGTRDYLQVDKNLNTQDLVEQKAAALLANLKTVVRTGSATVVGLVWLMTPGDYILVKSPSNGLPNWTMMQANSISISFNKSDGLVYGFELDNEDVSLALLLNSYENRLKKLERRDVPESLIRVETLTDAGEVDDAIEVWTNDILSGFKYGRYAKYGHHKKYADTGTGWVPVV